ncbi:PREDICTED: monocarboxylate transporter 12-B-like [Priapulus caudatus]|uniref:Monocarboxylate transporter 12-B-like n=1 Tax=Priapulus caudatus TaxID=37621 RepID=A0ABM1EM42_PRICU|nr:PREDICTED: monocarboxylate transporter 12-B-like [Priapulus caudatus]
MRRGPPNKDRPPPPDGGWGWVVVFSCSVCMALTMGQARSFGIYLLDIVESLDTDVSRVAPIQGLSQAISMIIGPAASVMIRKIGLRTTGIIGGFLAGLGMILGYISHNLVLLYITVGAINGVGSGIVNIITFGAISAYFEKRVARAIGMAMAGAGLIGLLIPLLVKWLIDEYRYTGAMLINGAIILNIIPLCGLIIPLEELAKADKAAASTPAKPSYNTSLSTSQLLEHSESTVLPETDGMASTNDNVSINVDKREAAGGPPPPPPADKPHTFAWDILKDARFWIICLCLIFGDAAVMNFIIYLPLLSVEIGGDNINEAINVSLSGVISAVNMLAWGALWDFGVFKKPISRQIGFAVLGIVNGIVVGMTGVISSYSFLMVWVIFIQPTLSVGSGSPLHVVIRDIATMEKFPDMFSASGFIRSPFTFLGSIVVGAFYEKMGSSASLVYMLLGGCAMAAGLLGILIPIISLTFYAPPPPPPETVTDKENPTEDTRF